MWRNLLLCLVFFSLSACVSYYEEYEQSYYVPSSGYSYYYTSPLRLRGLSERDFYMLDNYPGDYFDTQFWSGISSISRFGIHTILQAVPR